MLSNPITATALIGTTVAVTAYETNLGGLKNSIEDITGMERSSLPSLTGGFIDLSGSTATAADSTRDYTAEAEAFAASVKGKMVPATDKLSSSFESNADRINKLTHSLSKLNKATDELKRVSSDF